MDKNKINDSRNRFLELSKKVTKAVPASKRRSAKEYLNPKLPSKLLWQNFKNIGLKDDPDHESIFTAEELNTFYCTLASHPSQLPIFCPSAENLGSTREQFSFRNVDNIEVRNAIFNVESMVIAPDRITLKFIKLILPLILPCITHIFNTILTKSFFPKTWKISNVLPILKVKNTCSLSDYRPISILPSLLKSP
jgi:hypothetical protein